VALFYSLLDCNSFSVDFQIVDKKYKLEMNAVDVLNLLGKHNYRVIGFATQADQKLVWTMEQRDFENENLNSGHQSHNNRHTEY
jgi:hypothetical protein